MQVRLVEIAVVPVVGRGVPVLVLLVFEIFEELLVLRVLVGGLLVSPSSSLLWTWASSL